MPQRGEIMVERLTGNRVMVIDVVSPEEMFEVKPLLSPFGSLVWFFLSGFVSRWFRQGAAASVTDRLRLVQPSDSSRSSLAV